MHFFARPAGRLAFFFFFFVCLGRMPAAARPSRYFESIGLKCVELDGTLPVRENTELLLNLPMLSSICYRHVHEGRSAAAGSASASAAAPTREEAPEPAAASAPGPSV